MRNNTHEDFKPSEVKPPSERSVGLLFAVVALIVALVWRNVPTVLWSGIAVSTALALVSFLAPRLLIPLNFLWFQLGLLLQRIVSPLVLFVLFALVFVPAGALMRLWYDPMRSRRQPDASSYWIDRDASGQPAGSMTNQF